ncbi:MAG: PEGA domain-containing protein [Ignavibacteria bacterium]|nr:PEGA domain-containing protein [Ignavibacteria bacterium]
MKYIFLTLFFLLESSFVFSQEQEAVLGGKGEQLQLYDNSWAILVGITSYNDASVSTRKFAVEDVKTLASLFSKLQFPKQNIIILQNEQATLLKIRESLNDLGKKIRSNDRFLLYWAGATETATEKGKEVGYLIPSDGRKKLLPTTSISLDEICRLSDNISAKHILVIIDNCMSGFPNLQVKIPPKISSTPIKTIISSRGFQVITAGRKNERHYESSILNQSIFSKAMKNAFWIGLLDVDKNGLITAEELYNYLVPSVSELAKQENFIVQHPVYATSALLDGQFIFPLKGLYYSLVIRDLPKKNTVKVNGKIISENKPSVKKAYESGTLTLEIESPGKKTFSEIVALNGDKTIVPKLDTLIEYSLDTNPIGANVKIDDENVGTTPFIKRLSVGLHRIEISKDGYLPLAFDVHISLGHTFDKKDLVKHTDITLTISELPDSSSVFLDGNVISKNKELHKQLLQKGIYTLEIHAPHYDVYSQTITLNEDETLIPEMKRLSEYHLETVPSGATVILDGKKVGQTPFQSTIISGTHTILLTKDLYDSLFFTTVVSADNHYDKKYLTVTTAIKATTQKDTSNRMKYENTFTDAQRMHIQEEFRGSTPITMLDIHVKPQTAKLFIDDRQYELENGNAIVSVQKGKHRIVVFNAGYEIYDGLVEIEEGKIKEITIVLESASTTMWWIYGGASAVIAGTVILLYKNIIEEKVVLDPYGNPPQFPPQP